MPKATQNNLSPNRTPPDNLPSRVAYATMGVGTGGGIPIDGFPSTAIYLLTGILTGINYYEEEDWMGKLPTRCGLNASKDVTAAGLHSSRIRPRQPQLATDASPTLQTVRQLDEMVEDSTSDHTLIHALPVTEAK